MRYIPRYDTFVKFLRLDTKGKTPPAKVEVPFELWRLMVANLVAQAEFDEKEYLRVNPDVEQALKQGLIGSAKEHYLEHGYFEGRFGASGAFDESWYRSRYSDVSAAIEKKAFKSAEEHFRKAGAGELRAPRKELEVECNRWLRLLSGPRKELKQRSAAGKAQKQGLALHA